MKITVTAKAKIEDPETLRVVFPDSEFVESLEDSAAEGFASVQVIPDEAEDEELATPSDRIRRFFGFCDKAVTVKLVPSGGALEDAIAFELAANSPLMLPMNLAGVFVSNNSGGDAKFTFAVLGDDPAP